MQDLYANTMRRRRWQLDDRLRLDCCAAPQVGAPRVLFAPQTGAVTRRDLKKSAERLSRRAMKLYDNASETMEQLAERGADVLDRTKEVASRIRT
jgi:hypothetical protein